MARRTLEPLCKRILRVICANRLPGGRDKGHPSKQFGAASWSVAEAGESPRRTARDRRVERLVKYPG